MEQQLIHSGFFWLLDYTLRGFSYGTSSQIELRTNNPDVLEIAANSFRPRGYDYSQEEFRAALTELSCEFERLFTIKKEDEFRLGLELLLNEGWSTSSRDGEESLKYSKRSSLNFGDYKPKNYSNMSLKYGFDKSLDPELIPAAMVIVELVGLNILNRLSNKYSAYDLGDEWRYVKHPRYETHIRFAKESKPDKSIFDEEFKTLIKLLLQEDIANRIVAEIRNTTSTLSNQITPLDVFKFSRTPFAGGFEAFDRRSLSIVIHALADS